jgi:formiminotetrahydrofolate cyclodeaminase
LGALYNVRINLKSLDDAVFVDRTLNEVERLERQIDATEKEILGRLSL